VFFVVDDSRSMLASLGPGSPNRFERAVALALELRRRLADVPAGVASLSDRVLPHLFPTIDRRSFQRVLTTSIGINRPPPGARSRQATDFGALLPLATARFYAASAKRRLAIVLSDGESRQFFPDFLARAFRRRHLGVLVVRVWNGGEEIWRHGRVDPKYQPDPASTAQLARLGGVYPESRPGAALRAARRFLGSGPTAAAGRRDRTVPLAPWVALVAAVPLAVLLRRR
jgi:hypothetical protein